MAQQDTVMEDQAGFLKSTFPVLFPKHEALGFADDEFDNWLVAELKTAEQDVNMQKDDGDDAATDDETAFSVITAPSTTADVREQLGTMDVDPPESLTSIAPKQLSPAAMTKPGAGPFMSALLSHGSTAKPPPDMSNKMLTENADVAFRSTNQPLVDLFVELEEVVSGPRLLELLDAAWHDDSIATLKIIFNSRSIHLGKSSRSSFYRCAGWLAKKHPRTLLANLRWLSRPVIQKKVEKKKDGKEGGQKHRDGNDDDAFVLVNDTEAEAETDDPSRFDVRNGVAHGYWKDLLNLLALQVQGKLDVLVDPRDGLFVEDVRGKRHPPEGKTAPTRDEAHAAKAKLKLDRHAKALEAFEADPVYRAMHLAVARLFAEQLRSDVAALRGADPQAKRRISLCAKWAPSTKLFHDKHTFVVSTIAELLFPESAFASQLQPSTDEPKAAAARRELYLRLAREAYRKDVSALRAHLDVVERNLTAGTFDKIDYSRVPSLAMKSYAGVFASKDTERFGAFVDDVASGKASISGAVLLPSAMIKAVRELACGVGSGAGGMFSKSVHVPPPPPAARGSRRVRGVSRPMVGTKRTVQTQAQRDLDKKIGEISAKVLDGQWRTLVQRIKDSGVLSSSLAICDVSGSMGSPTLADGTTPMDSSIGLSLLVAEVTAPPFGGAFITFSEEPEVQRVDLKQTLLEKYRRLQDSDFGYSTDFVAVFEKLILPMAVENKVKPEDMVKRVFVFSDMQFNEAQNGDYAYAWGLKDDDEREPARPDWSTSFERIEKKYKEAGYEMPELVFWNLAGGRAGVTGAGDPTAPKPVEADQPGTALVSGYSQGMLKVFLEGGTFDEEDEAEAEAEAVVEVEVKDGKVETVEPAAKRVKTDPMAVVRKAIGHKAYAMLRVVD